MREGYFNSVQCLLKFPDDHGNAGGIHFRQQQGEAVSKIATHHVVIAKRRLQPGSHPPQQHVSGIDTKAGVDLAKAAEVEHDQAKLFFVTARA